MTNLLKTRWGLSVAQRRARSYFIRCIRNSALKALQSGKLKKAKSRPLLLDTLEPRVLFSAAPVEVPQEPEGNSGGDVPVQELILDSGDVEETESLTEEDIERLADEALARWMDSGLSAEQIEALASIDYELVDLEEGRLGAFEDGVVFIDIDAAGLGWFVDETASADEEFVLDTGDGILRAAEAQAGNGVDLLSVLMHEQGHQLGLLDEYEGEDRDSVMFGLFAEGERRLVADGIAQDTSLEQLAGIHYASAVRVGNVVTITGDGDNTSDFSVNGAGDLIMDGTNLGQVNTITHLNFNDAATGNDRVRFRGGNAFDFDALVAMDISARDVRFEQDVTVGTAANPNATVDIVVDRVIQFNHATTGASSLTAFDGDVNLTADGTGGGNGRGIQMLNGAAFIQTRDGDINLDGEGRGTGSNRAGVWLQGSGGERIESTGSGNITIIGAGSTAAGSNDSNRGVSIGDGNTLANAIVRTNTGFIDIDGTGGSDGGAGDDFNNGVLITGTVETTGAAATATIMIDGTGGAGDRFNRGVVIQGTGSVETAEGNISITGNGAGTGDQNRGIQMSNTAQVTSNGAGSITLDGTGGNGGTRELQGVYMNNDAVIESAGSGAVTIDGNGGNGSGNNNSGVRLLNNAQIKSGVSGNIDVTGQGGAGGADSARGVIMSNDTLIETTGTGNIDITGTGGAGLGNFNHGVQTANNARISSTAAGNISVTGTGGTGSDILRGVYLSGTSIVDSAGTGTITIDGTSPMAINGKEKDGFQMDSNTRVQSANGDISITGTGGGSILTNPALMPSPNPVVGSDPSLDDESRGVQIDGRVLASNNANITIDGTGGHSRTRAEGVALNNANSLVQAANGTITITGDGGTLEGGVDNLGALNGAGNPTNTPGVENVYGISVANGRIETTGTGDVNLTGTGPTSLVNNSDGYSGINVANIATVNTAGSGNISFTGTGGTALVGNTADNNGIRIAGDVTASGTGSITFDGTGGEGRRNNDGVVLTNNSALVQTVSGSIDITGTGGDRAGANNNDRGVELNSGDIISTSGNVTITGTHGPDSNGDADGIRIANSTVTSGNGTLTLNGNSRPGGEGIELDHANAFVGNGQSGNINLNTDRYSGDQGAVHTTGTIRFAPLTAGRDISVGRQDGGGENVNNEDQSTHLEIADNELDKINTAVDRIEFVTTGDITVDVDSVDNSYNAAPVNEPDAVQNGGTVTFHGIAPDSAVEVGGKLFIIESAGGNFDLAPFRWSLTGSTTATEGGASPTYTVNLRGHLPTGETAQINLGLTDNTAEAADHGAFVTAVNAAVATYNGNPANPGSVAFNGTTLTYTGVTDMTMAPLVITLPIVDDTLVEAAETYTVALTQPTTNSGEPIVMADPTNNSVTTTIAASDTATWSISQSGSPVTEGGNVTYSVDLTNTILAGETATIDLGLTNTSTNAADYNNFVAAVNAAVAAYTGPGALTFNGTTLTYTGGVGDTAMGTLNIVLPTVDDTLIEGQETFNVALANPGGTATSVALDNTADDVTTTINDNDVGTWSITQTGSPVQEGNNVTYKVALAGVFQQGETGTVEIDLTNNTTTAADYGSFTAAITAAVAAYTGPGTVAFNGVDTLTYTGGAGGTTMANLCISLNAINDGVVEPNETFDVTLSNPGSGTGATTNLGTSSSVTTTIIPSNTAPDAVNDTDSITETGGANTGEAATTTGNVVTNDSDPDSGDTPGTTVPVTNISFTGTPFQATNPGGAVTAGTTSTTGTQIDGAYGTLTIGADGTYSYALNDGAVDQLDAGDNPTEVFTYTLRDSGGLTDTATLTITVNGTNDDPIANNDTDKITETGGATTTESASIAGNVLTGVSANGTGAADTDVDENDNIGTNDANDNVANPSVNLTNITFGGTPFQATNPGGAVTGGTTSATGTLIDGAFGTLRIGADGSYTYALNDAAVDALDAGDNPTEVFTYTINDGQGGTDTATITITVCGTNDDPIAVNDTNSITETGGANTGEAASVTGDVSTNDSDVDDDDSAIPVTNISFAGTPFQATNPGGAVASGTTSATGTQIDGAFGILTIGADGTYSYALNDGAVDQLDAGDMPVEVFTYTINDGNGGTDTATISITVNGTNDDPIANNDTDKITETGGATTTESASIAGNVLTGVSANGTGAADTDVDENDNIGANDANNNVANPSVNLTNITFGGTPFQATNPGGAVAGGTTSATGTLIDGAFGTLRIGADGSYTYALNDGAVDALDAGDNPTEVFTYTINDGQGGTDTATITITVCGTNDDPVLVNDVNAITETGGTNTGETATVTGNVVTNDTDVDADDTLGTTAPVTNITFGGTPFQATNPGGAVATGTTSANGTLIDGAYGTLTIGADGSYSYALNDAAVDPLNAGATPTEVFTYTINDGNGGVVTATLTITVNGTNDTPIAVDDCVFTDEDTTITIDDVTTLLANDSDVDGPNPLQIVNISPFSANGAAVSIVGGDVVYNPTGSAALQALDEGDDVNDTFTYTIWDGTPQEYVSGLTAGSIVGPNGNVQPGANPGNLGVSAGPQGFLDDGGPRDAEREAHWGAPVNKTLVYTGEIFLTAGQHNFLMMSDDQSRLTINGTPIIDGSTAGANSWNVESAGSFNNTGAAGWFSIEIRTSNGNGGYGFFEQANGASGSWAGLAAGFLMNSTNVANTTDQTQDFVYPEDNGAMSLFRTFTYPADSISTATVTVKVEGRNDTPDARDDYNRVYEGSKGVDAADVSGNLLVNDRDVDANDGGGYVNNSVTVREVNGTQIDTTASQNGEQQVFVGMYGTLTVNENGDYTYNLDDSNTTVNGLAPGATLQESFSYILDDNHLDVDDGIDVSREDGATLWITIYGSNDGPVAEDNTAAVAEDTILTDSGNVITDNDGLDTNVVDGNNVDFDVDDATANLSVLNVDGVAGNVGMSVPGTYGSVTINASGDYTYTLNNGTNGVSSIVQDLAQGETVTDTFDYTITDGTWEGDGLMSIGLARGNMGGGDNANWQNMWDAIDAAPAGSTGNNFGGTGRNLFLNTSDTDAVFDYGNQIGGGGGNFVNSTLALGGIAGDGPGGGGGPYDVADGSSYSIRAQSYLYFHTPGTYTIAMGSDDGRRISLTDASASGYGGFTARNGQVTGTFTAGNTMIERSGGTGHAITMGTFTVPAAGTVLFLDAFYSEGGGGDSGEISIASGAHSTFNTTDFSLLRDGAEGIALSTQNNFQQCTHTATLTVTITGENDVRNTVADVADVFEDAEGGPDTATGNVLANDIEIDIDGNNPDDILQVGTIALGTGSPIPVTAGGTTITGIYGDLVIDSSGTYTYVVDHSRPIVQALDDGQVMPEIFTYTQIDGDGAVITETLTINVHGENDAPVVSNVDPGPQEASDSGAPVYIAPTATLSDIDDPFIEGLTIISTDFDTGADVLRIDPAFVLPPGVTVTIAGGTLQVTSNVPNTVTIADYEAILQSVQFLTSGSESQLPRFFDITIFDGEDISNIATTEVQVEAGLFGGSNVLQRFRFEEVDYHTPLEVDEEEGQPLLKLMPIYSGVADPGTVIKIKIVGSAGQSLSNGESTVVADIGGNWLAKMPGLILDKEEHHYVVMEVTPPSWGDRTDPRGSNLKTYFAPAVNIGHNATHRPTPGSVIEGAVFEVKDELPELRKFNNATENQNNQDWRINPLANSGIGGL